MGKTLALYPANLDLIPMFGNINPRGNKAGKGEDTKHNSKALSDHTHSSAAHRAGPGSKSSSMGRAILTEEWDPGAPREEDSISSTGEEQGIHMPYFC